MQIPVNTNIDNYKDDFFKGFSAKETAYAGVILLIYLIVRHRDKKRKKKQLSERKEEAESDEK